MRRPGRCYHPVSALRSCGSFFRGIVVPVRGLVFLALLALLFEVTVDGVLKTEAGVVGNPQVSLSTNQETYNPGDTLVLNATLQAGTENNVVDGYIVAISPDGSAFFLNDDLTTFTPLSDGAASSTAELPVGRTDLLQTTPAVVRSFGIVDATVQVFSRIVEKALPAGRYAIMAIAAKARSNVLDVTNWIANGTAKFLLSDRSCPPPPLPELSPAEEIIDSVKGPVEIDKEPLGNRIPLILIHGISFGDYGGDRCQWDNFLLTHFAKETGDKDLRAQVKPYWFAYESSIQAARWQPTTSRLRS